MPNPHGRPPKINRIATRDDDGNPVTTGQHIVNRVRATWAPWADAAASVGISRYTLRAWRRKGAEARARAEAGETISRTDAAYVEFVNDLEQAEAQVMLACLGGIAREARGGFEIRKTVETVEGGKVVRKVTTTETARGLWTANAWLLQHRRPDLFHSRLEVTGKDGEPVLTNDERAERLSSYLEAFLQGAEQGKQVAEAERGAAT